MATVEGMSGGGQGIPMTSSPSQYTQQATQGYGGGYQASTTGGGVQASTTTSTATAGQPQSTTTTHHGQGQTYHQPQQQQYQQQPQQQQQYHGGQQQQHHHGMMGGGAGGFMGSALNSPGQLLDKGKPESTPALATMMQAPDDPTTVETMHVFLVVLIILCAIASMVLCGLAGSSSIPDSTSWMLALSATVITAVGVVFFEMIKRLVANTSQLEAENAAGISVLAHANIRAVAVKALAYTHHELKKTEMAFRDTELLLVLFFGVVAAILSGISALYDEVRVVVLIAAYLNAICIGVVVTFEILANGKRIEAHRIEDQLKRNSLVADFLRADAGKKHLLLQDRVEALTTV